MSQPTIHIETDLIAKGTYLFLQTWVDGIMNVEERDFTETHEDRMCAAMTNLGYACRWFADKNISRGCVCIVPDTEANKGENYHIEHNDLFKAIHSQYDYDKNRAKYSIFYGKYIKFFDRIRELANVQEITFTQNAQAVDEIRTQGKEFIEGIDTNPHLVKNKKWTADNILHIRMNGVSNIVTCQACQHSIQYQQTDNFVPFRQQWRDATNKDRSLLIKSNKQLITWFQNRHLELHNWKKKLI